MGMPATSGDWTVDMLDALPEDGQRYELIDGVLFVTPGPGESHQDIVGALFRLLHEYLSGHGVGKAMISPADIRRGDRTRNRVQPDVFVVRLVGGSRPAYPYELADLLLAVEVVSPSNPILDNQVKRDLYLREGVVEYWVINPDARNISLWRGRDDPGDEVGSERSLLVLCAAFRAPAGGTENYPNLTVKKIPKQVLSRCEWGHDDYSLKVENLPKAPPAPPRVDKRGQIDLI